MDVHRGWFLSSGIQRQRTGTFSANAFEQRKGIFCRNPQNPCQTMANTIIRQQTRKKGLHRLPYMGFILQRQRIRYWDFGMGIVEKG
jgi:hypothetical protein